MKTFNDFYGGITDHEKPIVNRLRAIVFDVNPNFREKISYGVPYYFLHTRVCFLWPASVRPGPRSGVVLGFCQGHLMSDERGLLDRANRKVVATLIFHGVNEIEPEIIRELLEEAIFVDYKTSIAK